MQSYSAGYEPADAAMEEQYFDKVSEVREEKPGSTGSADAKAALLEGTQQATGTSILLKVMAGDKIAVNAENFYEQLQTNPEDVVSGEAVMAQVLNAMAGGAGSLNGSEGGMANALSNGADPAALQAAYESLQAAETDSTRPRSYLNYLFFDEQMQLVAEHSRLWQADGEADWKSMGTEEAIEVPENGYIAVYLSNQGAEPVYYDNLAVTLTPGALLEEKHYYPYGLPIQGWGTAASGSLPNRQRYQGNEYREEAGLNWMDFHNRQYDPQLCRFLGVDALADAGGQQVLSPYHAMGCNPAMLVDPFGLQSGKSDPRPPGSLLTSGNNPGTSGWGAIAGYYKNTLGSQPRPAELQGMLGAMAMMRILSGDAAGAASRMSPGGGSAMSSYEQMVQIDGWQRQWRRYQRNRSENILDAFYQFVYNLNNGYEIDFNHDVLDQVVVQGVKLQQTVGRPDDDGYLTYAESVYWYRYGNGEPLNVDLGKISVPGLYVSSFNGGVGSRAVVNLIKKTSVWDMILRTKAWNDARVYGNLTFKLYPNNEVKAFQDKYDFEMHSWSNPINWLRNAATVYGDPGAGTPYKINFYGTLSIPLAPLPVK